MNATQRAKAYAQDAGFDTVELVGEWHGFQVFEYYNADDPEGGEVGLPSFILATETKARTTQNDEAFQIITALFPDE